MALVALAQLGGATLIPGGGKAASDCYGQFDVQGADGTSRKVRCVDGDPACDLDGACQGTCTFDLAVCLNQSVTGCTPAPQGKPAKVRGGTLSIPAVQNVEPVCGERTRLEVALRGRKRNKPRSKKLTLVVVTTGTPKTDTDTVVLGCQPRRDACPTTTTTTSTTSTTLPPRAAVVFTIYGLAAGNQLLRFSSADPSAVTSLPVSGLGGGQTLRCLDVRPRTGGLYGVAAQTGSANNSVLSTYRIDPMTGVATLVGQTSAIVDAGDVPTGCDFNPTVDRLRYVNTSDENLRINPNTGTLAGDDTNVNPAPPAVIAAAYDRNFDRISVTLPPNASIPTTLYVIDRAAGRLAIQGSLNGTPTSANAGILTTVGVLGSALLAGSDGGFDIVPSADGERAFAALKSAADGMTRLYTLDLSTGQATAIGLIGDGGAQLFSLTIARHGIVVVGADAGGLPEVTVFETPSGTPILDFLAYPAEFRGGVRVAAGDVTGDGVPDVITGAGPGDLPLVRVFDGITGNPISGALGSFLAYDVGFTGGVFVASGDVDGDGYDDVITGAGAGGEPRVRVFSTRVPAELLDVLAYDPPFQDGVHVAAGDTDLAGLAEVMTGPDGGASPAVRLFTGPFDGLTFLPYPAGFAGGVYVAMGDVDGDGRADLITGAGAGGEPLVKVYSGLDATTLLANFSAFAPAFAGGARVGAADVDGDGRLDILAGAGPGGLPEVRAFSGVTQAALSAFSAFSPTFSGGVFVAGARD